MIMEAFVNKTSCNSDELPVQVLDILLCLRRGRFNNQRLLAEKSGKSLGFVNKSVKMLEEAGLINKDLSLTLQADSLIEERRPQRAVILAAGSSLKLGPINSTTPTALLEIEGEILIERQIRQLHEAGITDITVVVGFLKERFDYLVDMYGVKLSINNFYATKNNVYSVSLVSDRLSNCYIVPSDIWSVKNPYKTEELYSWYMVSDCFDKNSFVRVNKKNELIRLSSEEAGNRMIGIAYLLDSEACIVRSRIEDYISDERHDDSFWEEALFDIDRMIINARVIPEDEDMEITTYEQYRDIDLGSKHLKKDASNVITSVFGCKESDIKDVEALKKGMTNRSFLFTIDGSKYILRIPGEGTEHLINRKQEADVYRTISGLGLCDDPVYMDTEKGFKITRFLEGTRVCNTEHEEDLKKCMKKLKAFHKLNLKVNHVFDIYEHIEFYESLWNGYPSLFRDYLETKEKIMSLKVVLNCIKKEWCLTHIDAVPDNFLFYQPCGSTEEELQLTDWEYAGMQDPHVDIAMFCIYSLFDKQKCDQLIDMYFEGKCNKETRGKIYCYIASCGLLWSNWCEYKRQLGIEFGEYNMRQYRYAKEFFKYAKEIL